jgi:peptidoglycan/LPS O-acetylase OafA/YrhL
MSEGAVAPRNPGIDALRGISIVLVVVHHVALRIPLRDGVLAAYVPRQILSALSYNGYAGVFVFFVISGFLIALHSMQRWGSLPRIDARAFYVRRAARILPALLLIVATLSLLHLARVPYYTIDNPRQSLAGAVLSALGLYLNWYEGRTGYLPGNWDVLWSLSIEEAFYVGFPLVCVLLGRERWIWPPLVVLALALPWSLAALAGDEIWQEKAYIPGMAAIATGIVAAMLVHRSRRPSWGVVNAVGVIGGLGLAAAMLAGRQIRPLIGDGIMLLLTASVGCLLACMHWRHTGGRSRVSAWTRPLRSFGRLSYEIYLTHMFVVFPLVHLFHVGGFAVHLGVLWYAPALALSWALGLGLARAVVEPCERRLRRLLTRAGA